ncbi:MAG: hypothetical protein NC548_50190 [Lachnospiraceae bacterium]|nr:hypothetical protein [Lachnospiraceae bacterium]
MPRRTAYPRVAEYAERYAAVDSLPLLIEANAQAMTSTELMPDGTVWLNIEYPAYNARVYFTLTPVDSATVEAALENRAERIGLNLGNAQAESEHFTNPNGYYTTLVKAPQALPLPVHFIAVKPGAPKWLVSGSAMIDGTGPQTPADSIGPVIETIYRDISHAMQRLAP